MSEAIAPSALPLFPSLASLRSAHNDLLREYRAARQTPELLTHIEAFIIRGRDSGAWIDSDADRQNAQSLLDYWVTVLYQANHTAPDATLADFDLSQAPELPDDQCPYVGLSAFRETDHRVFFGRESMVESILARLAQERLLAVFGASGSGKSSLVLGGVVPALKEGAIPDSDTWHYYPTMVPGSHPLDNVAQAVSTSAADFKANPNHLAEIARQTGRPSVLVIDQFEELFTLCANEEERTAFVGNLRGFVDETARTNTVLITMRSDFEDQVVLIPELSTFFVKAVHVTALGALELRAAIEKPAAAVGLKFDDGIVDDLVKEVLGQPTGLPLLQFALLKLWQSRERNRITRTAFRKLGNVRAALGASADELYNGLLPEDQTVLRRIILRLVRPGEGLEVTSNRVRVSSLAGLGANVDRVLGRLLDARLLRLTKGETAKDDQVEVAHEALVRNWPSLVEWLGEERIRLRSRLRLTAAAEFWEQKDRDPGGLLGGSLLTDAAAYDDLNDLEREFVEASKAAAVQAEKDREQSRRREEDLERQAAARKNQKKWIRLLYGAIGLLLALLAFIISLLWNSHQLTQINIALLAAQRTEQLKAGNQANAAVLMSAFIFRQAWDRDPKLHGLIDSYLRDSLGISFDRVLHSGRNRILSLVLSEDGESLAFADENGNIRLKSGSQPVKKIAKATGGVTALAFSDTTAIASLSDTRGPNQVQIRSLDGATVLAELGAPQGHSFLAMATAHQQPALALASDDGSVVLWNWKKGAAPIRIPGSAQSVVTLDFSADNSRLAAGTYDKTVQLWDIGHKDKPPVVMKATDVVNSVSLSADGDILAAGMQSGILLWDLQRLSAGPKTLFEGKSVLSVKVLSHDSLLAGLYSGEVYTINGLDSGNAHPAAISHSEAPINSVAFGRKGQIAYSGSSDGTVRKISPASDAQPLAGVSNFPVSTAIFDLASRQLAVRTDDQNNSLIYLFKLEGSSVTLLATMKGHSGPVPSMAFANNGKSLIFGDDKGDILKWGDDKGDVRQWDQAKIETIGKQGSPILSVAAAVESSLIASSGKEGNIHLWQKAGCVSEIASRGGLLALRSDARWLAAGQNGNVVLWDLEDCGRPRPVPLKDAQQRSFVSALTFSAEGRWLAAAYENGQVRLWNFDKPQQAPHIFKSNNSLDKATSLAFSNGGFGGKLLAVGYQKGSIRAWDTENPDANPFTWNRHPTRIAAIGFAKAQDGTGVYSVDANFTVLRWLTTSSLVDTACNLTEDLSASEWIELLGQVPNKKVCPTR